MKKTTTHNIHSRTQEIPPTILTIFGATGDLSSDYLLPALVHMEMENLLPKNFHLVCVGRRDLTNKTYLDFIIKKSSVLKKMNPAAKARFLKKLTYYKGDFEDAESFKPLARILEDRDLPHRQTGKPRHVCYNRLYYFATSPQYFASIAHILKESGLLMSCASHERKVRVLVEKPFGFNAKSAHSLNQLLLKYFTEDQIYRIDHYQGKETVQNLMVVRFANSLFEPLWNKDFIDHIEISVLEKDGAENRQPYYNETGALKDMVQNHMLQILSLITMNEPKELTAEYIRDEKLKILKALVPPISQSPEFDNVGAGLGRPQSTNKDQDGRASAAPTSANNSWIIRGQYQGYTKEIKDQSETETYIAFKTFINTKRWQGVPMYLRTGKRLSKKIAEVSVHFKEPIRCLFQGCASNILTFRIQPDESVHLRLNNKIPGFGIKLHQGDYEFGYEKAFMSEIPSAYERLLLDFMEGDQRLFIRSDEIEAAWKFIDAVSSELKNIPLSTYKPGTFGPIESDQLMEKDIREWSTK